ncbi:MAG: anaerobic glycerol-3-phosphate dehydrogenase subunit A [Desulfobacterales bacterium]|nr:anaerobic glycerol-3-phosphate dehydrogenase subunit A [Desulfobacterales bacterium]
MARIETQVLIIGGGITGVGLARDLALRGVACLLVEARDICAGASGANHGLLHSGARYVRSDPTAAVECREEGALITSLAPHCIEETGGLFVAVAGDDERHIADFPGLCARCGIEARALDPAEALRLEPVLSERLTAAYEVPDAAVDPFQLALDNLTDAMDHGTQLMLHTRVTGFHCSDRRIREVRLLHAPSGVETQVAAEQVVNAAGAWAREVAALAGVELKLHYSKGSLLITERRLARRVINRLRPATDADILVPGGTVSILGTTSIPVESLDRIVPTVAESEAILEAATAMVPSLAHTRFLRAYAGVRPLVVSGAAAEGRALSRGFALLDHAQDGLDNFVAIVGGKLTTFRLMAEKTADLICARLGVHRPGVTRTTALPSFAMNQWTRAGLSPRRWMEAGNPEDLLLCECEMVPASALEEILAGIRRQGIAANLTAIGRRSRIGKGTCQGAFCGVRLSAHLYDRGELSGRRGLAELRAFLAARWRGLRPVLWDAALIQEELQEALHCGYFGLDLEDGA